jgi:hypothetical protein
MRKFGFLIAVMLINLTATFFSCNQSEFLNADDKKDYKPFDGNGLVTFNLNDTTKISYGECLYNPENEIGISFDSLLIDCRCPTGVQCFWAGYAAVGMHLYKGKQKPIYFELSTYTDKSRKMINDTTILDYNMRLIDCLPYPDITVDKILSDYKIKVLVTKAKK